ncbi:MAG TPA: response regulator [Phaeodactylibacter sp.]|nr:response regulator [Phaeodactylibacter sp.]
MKQKLDLVLLIDDNEADNYLHSLVLKEADLADHIVAKPDGEAALKYLNKIDPSAYPGLPQLLFLDINMPRMNGWEFLQAFDQLPEHKKAHIVIIMLTTSLQADDARRALENPNVSAYFNKPLTAEYVEKIVAQYFPEYA